ncbi:MAG: DUF6159 family protein [Gaiellales bacterium]
MGRFRLGLRMAGASWRVVRREKSLIAYPLLAAAFGIGYALLVMLPLGLLGFVAFGDNAIIGWVLLAIGLFGMNIGASFFGVAAAANASRVLDGQDPTLGTGIGVAWSRKGVIVKWGLVSATVGVVLQLVADRAGGLGGALIQAIGGAAWSIASFFVLPILALEGLGPFAALKKSLSVIRTHWGESIVGGAAVGFVTGLIALAGIGVAVLGVLAGLNASWAAGVPLIVIGLILFFIGVTVGSVLRAVFTVVVYRYATESLVTEGFPAEDLEQVFRPKNRRH